jgi:hypothetical protein
MASIEELLEGSRKNLARAQQIVEAGQKRIDQAQGYIAAWRREKNKQPPINPRRSSDAPDDS